MEIPLFARGSTSQAFTMTVEYESMGASYQSEIPRLTMQVVLRRGALWNQKDEPLYPVIMALHGVLYSDTTPDNLGASLQPPEDMPVALPTRDYEALVNLTFPMSDQFVKFLEEERLTKQGAQYMRLVPRLWGTVAATTSTAARANQSLGLPTQNLVWLDRVATGNSPAAIRIPRSEWLDRILPGLGYQRRILVELPLTRTPPVPQEYQQAAKSLEAASRAFEHEDYRGAMKYCREVLEHLGNLSPDKQLTAFCREKLVPAVGQTKATTIERVLTALWAPTSASSHANDFTADPAIASFFVETLAITLRYISTTVAV